MSYSSNVKIYHAVISDAKQITSVHIQAWRDTYQGILPSDYLSNISSEKRFLYWKNLLCNANHKVVFVAKVEDNVVGFIEVGISERKLNNEKNIGEIFSIYVLSDYQKNGIGFSLYNKAKDWCKARDISLIFLEVLESNSTAQVFYKKLGAVYCKRQTVVIGGREYGSFIMSIDV